MLEELQRRNYSQTTVTSYVKIVAAFAKHFDRPPYQTAEVSSSRVMK
jgi:hypothetical protein